MPATPTAVVLADDLTGACDAALPFLAAGRTVAVGLGGPPADPADVVAISTETRDVAAVDAVATVNAIMHALSTTPVSRLFKKVDSRLRGPVGAQLAAAISAAQAPFAVLAPALPRLGRIVEHGILHVPDAEPVDIGAHLGETARLATVAARAGTHPRQLADTIRRAAKSGIDVVVCDGATDAHLRAVVGAVSMLEPAPLLAGTSGLAAALAGTDDRAAAASDAPHHARACDPPLAGRVLFVLGSLEPALRRQAERLLHTRSVVAVGVDRHDAGVLPRSGHVMLESIRAGHATDDHGVSAELLARAACAAMTGERFDAVVCSGGAVAAAVCRKLGIESLKLVGELAPGFALARVAVDGDERLLALRSGGFGVDDELVRAYDCLYGVSA